MKVFLTGDMGEMGKSLKETLDYEWVGYDLVNGQDLKDYDKLVASMAGCKVVVHAAAFPHPNDELGFLPFFDVNVHGTVNVLEAARVTGVERFIYISSTAYYGLNVRQPDNHNTTSWGKFVPMYFPIDEKHPTQFNISPDRFDAYDCSKAMSEAACAWYGTNTKMQVLVLRFGPCVPDDVYAGNFETDGRWQTRSLFGWTHPKSVISAVDKAIMTYVKQPYMSFNIVDEPPLGVQFLRYQELYFPHLREYMGYNYWDTSRAQDILGWKPRRRRADEVPSV